MAVGQFPTADIVKGLIEQWSDKDFMDFVNYFRSRMIKIEGTPFMSTKIDPNMIIGPGDMPSPFGTPGNMPGDLNFPYTITASAEDMNLYESLLETKEMWEKNDDR